MSKTFARFKLFRMPDHLFGCVYCGAFAIALEQGRSPAARAMRAAALTLSSENDR